MLQEPHLHHPWGRFESELTATFPADDARRNGLPRRGRTSGAAHAPHPGRSERSVYANGESAIQEEHQQMLVVVEWGRYAVVEMEYDAGPYSKWMPVRQGRNRAAIDL